MKKDTVTLAYAKADLLKIAEYHMNIIEEWRFAYIVPLSALAVLLGYLLNSIPVGVLVFLPALYHAVRFIIAYRNFRREKKAVIAALDRRDMQVAVDTLGNISKETVYEPRIRSFGSRVRALTLREATFFNFRSGLRFRLPHLGTHYAWSRELYLSAEGLENISLEGDEFYCISLRNHPDLVYIYPCKYFTLDEDLAELLPLA